jgi:hypothetical protein
VASDEVSRRDEIGLLAAGFPLGLLAMTFGPVLAVGLIFWFSFPIVPLALAGLFALVAKGRKDHRLRCVAEGLVAAALFSIVACAVFLVGMP